jgi:hypothetical protein
LEAEVDHVGEGIMPKTCGAGALAIVQPTFQSQPAGVADALATLHPSTLAMLPNLAGGRGSFSLIQISCNSGSSSSGGGVSQFEAAAIIDEQLPLICEPHLLVSVLKKINKRMLEIRQEHERRA